MKGKILRDECPHIILLKYSRYAKIQVVFYNCKNLNTRKARSEVVQLFKKFVMDRSPFWHKLLTLKYSLPKKVIIPTVSVILSILTPSEDSEVVTPIIFDLCGKATFGIGYDTWNFCAEKELIEDFTSVLIHYVEELGEKK